MIMKLNSILCSSFKSVAPSWSERQALEVRRSSEKSGGHLQKLDPTRFRIRTFFTTSGWGIITKFHPDDYEAQVYFVFKFQVRGTNVERVRGRQSPATDRAPKQWQSLNQKVHPTWLRIWTFSTTSGWGSITKLHPDNCKAPVYFVFKFQVCGTIVERVTSLGSPAIERKERRPSPKSRP